MKWEKRDFWNPMGFVSEVCVLHQQDPVSSGGHLYLAGGEHPARNERERQEGGHGICSL